MIILRDQINIKLNINSYALAALNFEIIKEIKVLFDSRLYEDLEFTFPILFSLAPPSLTLQTKHNDY